MIPPFPPARPSPPPSHLDKGGRPLSSGHTLLLKPIGSLFIFNSPIHTRFDKTLQAKKYQVNANPYTVCQNSPSHKGIKSTGATQKAQEQRIKSNAEHVHFTTYHHHRRSLHATKNKHAERGGGGERSPDAINAHSHPPLHTYVHNSRVRASADNFSRSTIGIPGTTGVPIQNTSQTRPAKQNSTTVYTSLNLPGRSEPYGTKPSETQPPVWNHTVQHIPAQKTV